MLQTILSSSTILAGLVMTLFGILLIADPEGRGWKFFWMIPTGVISSVVGAVWLLVHLFA